MFRTPQPDFNGILKNAIATAHREPNPSYFKSKRTQAFISNAAAHGDRVLHQRYGYETVNPIDSPEKHGGVEPFGWTSHKNTAAAIIHHLDHGGPDDLNTLADIAHKGWNAAVHSSKDPSHTGEGLDGVDHEKAMKKNADRQVLAATPYHALPTDEQQKDQVLAAAILHHYKSNSY